MGIESDVLEILRYKKFIGLIYEMKLKFFYGALKATNVNQLTLSKSFKCKTLLSFF